MKFELLKFHFVTVSCLCISVSVCLPVLRRAAVAVPSSTFSFPCSFPSLSSLSPFPAHNAGVNLEKLPILEQRQSAINPQFARTPSLGRVGREGLALLTPKDRPTSHAGRGCWLSGWVEGGRTDGGRNQGEQPRISEADHDCCPAARARRLRRTVM